MSMSAAKYYVVHEDRVLVLWDVTTKPIQILAEQKQVLAAPSFERIGEGSGTEHLSRAEIERLRMVWFYGRPDCTGPTYMTREQAEAWIRQLKRGEIRERAAS